MPEVHPSSIHGLKCGNLALLASVEEETEQNWLN